MQSDEVLVELFEAILKPSGEEIAAYNEAGGIKQADKGGLGLGGEPEKGVGFFFGDDLVELFDSAYVFESLKVFLAKNHGDRSCQKESD